MSRDEEGRKHQLAEKKSEIIAYQMRLAFKSISEE